MGGYAMSQPEEKVGRVDFDNAPVSLQAVWARRALWIIAALFVWCSQRERLAGSTGTSDGVTKCKSIIAETFSLRGPESTIVAVLKRGDPRGGDLILGLNTEPSPIHLSVADDSSAVLQLAAPKGHGSITAATAVDPASTRVWLGSDHAPSIRLSAYHDGDATLLLADEGIKTKDRVSLAVRARGPRLSLSGKRGSRLSLVADRIGTGAFFYDEADRIRTAFIEYSVRRGLSFQDSLRRSRLELTTDEGLGTMIRLRNPGEKDDIILK
jgi:hypothetical protein